MGKPRQGRPELVLCVALAVLTLAVYWQTSEFDFTNFDDNTYVARNDVVSSGLTWHGVAWAFTARRANNWHPLTWISHMVDVQFSDLDPGAHHMTSVLFHVANVLLLFAVLNRMTGRMWSSAFVAALFAVHPLHAESVAWVAERKDLLSTFFWLLTMLAYVRYAWSGAGGRGPGDRRQKSRSIGLYVLVALFFALGLMCKPMLVSLPIVLLLVDFWPLGRLQGPGGHSQITNHKSQITNHPNARHLLLEKTPLFVLAAASCAVTFTVQKTTGAVATLDAYPLGVRLANGIWAYVGYLVKTVWPAGLACYYPHPGPSLPVWQTLLSALVLVAVTVLAVRGARTRPYLLVGWLWYLVTLVPVIGLVQVGKQAMADRYTYVPLIGIFVIAAWGIPDLARRLSPTRGLPAWLRGACAIAAAGVVVALTLAAHRQTGYWRNDNSIWLRALAVTRGNALAHFNLGTTLATQGDVDEAIRHFEEAVRIDPRKTEAHCNLGAMLGEKGKLDEAIEHFQAAVALEPRDARSQSNLGMALVQRGGYAEAIRHLRAALKAHPEDTDSQEALSAAIEQAKQTR